MAWVAVAMVGASAAKKQKKAGKVEQQAVQLQNKRARLTALKEYRAARAQVITGVISSGASIESSGAQGIKGSLQSQLKENIEYSVEQEELGAQSNQAKEQAAKMGFISQAFGLGANIASSASTLRKTTTPSTSSTTTNTSPFQTPSHPEKN